MQRNIRLVINADDFGFTDGISRGIIQAFEAGTVRSTSLMPTMPGFDTAVRLAQAAGPRLGVGLHFTLTVGRPITRAPSLTDADGEFMSHARLVRRMLRGGVRANEIEVELGAQLDRCVAAGIRLTHLDGHHHVHSLPAMRQIARRAAAAAGIRWVRHPRERFASMLRPAKRFPERLSIWLLAGGAPRGPDAPRHADHFLGSALFDTESFREGLLRQFDALPEGTSELMVHPGYVDAPLPGGDWYTKPRERELAALTSDVVRDRIRALGIDICHFGEIP